MDAYLAKALLERIAKLEAEVRMLRGVFSQQYTTPGQNWNYAQIFPNYTTTTHT